MVFVTPGSLGFIAWLEDRPREEAETCVREEEEYLGETGKTSSGYSRSTCQWYLVEICVI